MPQQPGPGLDLSMFTETSPRAVSSAEVTTLSPDDEARFRRWIAANGITDADHPSSHYDYRGYWKDVAARGDDQRKTYSDGPHFPDTYKQHGHPTFSIESKYSKGAGDGGRWDGERFVPQSTPAAAPVDLSMFETEQPDIQTRGLNWGGGSRRSWDDDQDPAHLPDGSKEDHGASSWLTLPNALRIGGGIVGGVAGSVIPGAGTAAGTAIGGALGAGAGEGLAEFLEVRRHQRKELNPWQIGTQAAIGAVPLGKIGSVASGAIKGAGLGAGATVATSLAESGELPELSDVGKGALYGGAFGGGAVGVLKAGRAVLKGRVVPAEPPPVRIARGRIAGDVAAPDLMAADAGAPGATGETGARPARAASTAGADAGALDLSMFTDSAAPAARGAETLHAAPDADVLPARGGASALEVPADPSIASDATPAQSVGLSPDEHLFRSIRDDARAQGYQGTDAQLRMEFRKRLEQARSLSDEMTATGDPSRALLKAIADRGGLDVQHDVYSGELANLAESSQSFAVGRGQNRNGGVRSSHAMPAMELGGVPSVLRNGSGLKLEYMIESLQQDPRFAPFIEEPNDLLTALEDATKPRPNTPSLESTLEGVGVRRGTPWWDEAGSIAASRAGATAADLDFSMFDDASGIGGGHGNSLPPSDIGGEGGGIPPQQPLSARGVSDEAFLSKLPEDIREPLRHVWSEYAGFEDQRRGVQPLARTQALANGLELPETLPAGHALNAEGVTAAYDRLISKQREFQALDARLKNRDAGEPLTDAEWVRHRELEVERVLAGERVRGAVAETGRSMRAIRAKVEELKALQAVQQSHDPSLITETAKSLQSGGWFRQYIYGNLVSGIASQERNVMGNSLMLVQDILGDVATGKPRAAVAMTVGALSGLPRGLKEFAYVMRHGGIDPAGAGKAPVYQEMPGGMLNPWNDALRMLQASDRLGRAISNQAEVTRRAFVEAARGGDGSLLDRMARLKAEHPEWYAEADAISTNRLFQSESGKTTKGFLTFRDSIPAHIGFLISPFVRISANLIRMGVSGSPAPYVLKLAEKVGGDRFSTEFARNLSAPGRVGELARARAAFGSLALAALTPYVLRGGVTGDGPREPGRRALWLQENQPNSIKVGGRWVSLQTLPGVGLPLQALANAVEASRDLKESGKQIDPDVFAVNVLARTGNSILSQSFLQGIEDLQNLMQNPGAYAGRAAGRFASMFDPLVGLQRSIAQTIDPTVRAPQNPTETLRASTPGLSQTVAPLLNPYGEPIQRQQSPLTVGVLRLKQPTNDPITQNLLKLRVPLARPTGDLSLPEGVPALTPAQQLQLAQARGRGKREDLEALILQNPQWWASLDPEEQKELIAKTKAASTRQVNQAAIAELMRDALVKRLQRGH